MVGKSRLLEKAAPPVWLEPFDPRQAECVASWVRSDQEAYWLAPKTTPPLTAQRIRCWALPNHEALQLRTPEGAAPLAYGELNLLNGSRRHFWLGHLIVDPDCRGRGLGRELTRRLLQRAFYRRGAQKVSLVVFPENVDAIACYRAAGLHDDGAEEHLLAAYDCRARLLRMSADALP